jgi:hypothetical protein
VHPFPPTYAKEVLPVRRFATIALSLITFLGLTGAWAQDEKKKEEPAKNETKADDKDKKAETQPAPEPTIPPEVQAKIDAARRAVAEAIVAAQDAGLVQTSIDPPPILDILIYGRANDEAAVKDKKGVSPEVMTAWFTGYGKTPGINFEKDVRIFQPSKGLKDLHDKRAEILRSQIAAVRQARADAGRADEKKAADDKAAEEKAKKDADEKAKKDAEAKKDEPKKDEPKGDEPKKDQ